MSDSSDSYNTDDGLSTAATGEITVAAVIIIFILFAVSLILYLRAKGYSGTIGAVRPRSRGPESAPDQPSQLKQALDPSILKSLPAVVFRLEDFAGGGLECSVCLSELRDGEKARLLPKCRHGFHVECIDMWFMSNSTCPLCRNPVGADNSIESSAEITAQPLEVVSESGNPAESQNSSAKLDEGSSSSGGLSFSEKRRKGMLVIDIPRRAMEGFSSSSNTPLPSNRMPAEGIKSPALERLRSLRRILSRGSLNNNCVGSSCSPRASDIERGIASG